jgi:CBS domain-containing protein/uncharacterized membrane protein
MQASDVMTRDVVMVSADAPIPAVARTLLAHGISAAPVVDADGLPIGMVSENDLVVCDETARPERRDWWLRLLAGDLPHEADFLTQIGRSRRTARDVMASPVVTVAAHTPLTEVAQLLGKHRIKRVPVMDAGKMVGIVSRADLLRAMAVVEPGEGVTHGPTPHHGFLEDMMGIFAGARHTETTHGTPPVAPPPPAAALTADALRHLVADFHHEESRHREMERRAAARRREALAEEVIETHVTDELWQALLHRARLAAAAGQTEIQLLRFPNTVCSDDGRAINVGRPDWGATLRGEAAELYARWERELKGRGFHISAHVLEFPDGKPGDIGLFLVWGDAL